MSSSVWSTINPLTDAAPAEVPLTRAPLIRVIAQLRFALIASVEQRAFIAAFQERVRQSYPQLKEERALQVLFGPAGPVQNAEVFWRFVDASGDWRVTLAPTYLSLETTNYTSRAEFLERLRVVTVALYDTIDPRIIERLGVRYIDRVTEVAPQALLPMIRPEVSGLLGTSLHAHLVHVVNEARFTLPGEATLLARSGWVPKGMTVDAAAIEVIDEPSWILDLDVSRSNLGAVDVDAVLRDAGLFAERAYCYFRWAVSDAFLRHFGGAP